MSSVSYLSPEEQEAVREQRRAGNALMKEELEKRLQRKSGKLYEQVRKAQSRNAATELFRREQFRGEIFDPCRGDDGIIEAAFQNGNQLYIDKSDFLDLSRGCVHIVSEPRIDLAEAYARKALSLVTGKVAFLLPLDWLATPETKTLFDETKIARIHVLTRRLRFRKGAMCWYVWDRPNFERPGIRWI